MIHEGAGRSSSLASMTPEVQIAKQSSSPSILETKSKRVALVAASASSSMRSLELSDSTLAEIELKTLCEKRLHHWCKGLFIW